MAGDRAGGLAGTPSVLTLRVAVVQPRRHRRVLAARADTRLTVGGDAGRAAAAGQPRADLVCARADDRDHGAGVRAQPGGTSPFAAIAGSTSTHGVLCAAAFGLAAFVRIDMLMFVTPLVAGFLVLIALERRWTRPVMVCADPLTVLSAHAIAHAVLVSTPYTERIIHHALHGRSGHRRQPSAAAAGAGGGCGRVAAVHSLQGVQAGGSRGASCVHRDSRGRGVSDLASGDRRVPGDAHEPAWCRPGGGGCGDLDR